MATGSNRGRSYRKSGSGAKRSNAYRKSRSTGSKAGRQDRDDGILDEIILLLVFAFSALLFLSDLKLIGSFGKAVSGVLFGIFGIGAYLVPFVIFLATAFLISNKGRSVGGAKAGAYGVLLLIFCAVMHLTTMKDYTDRKLTDFYTICSEDRTGGGFLGAVFGAALSKVIGRVGTFIVLIVLAVICGVIITEKSFIRGLRNSSQAVYSRSREGAKRYKAHRVERNEVHKTERELRSRERLARKQEEWEERLESVEEKEAQIEERRLRRIDKKVSGVMLDTRIVDDYAETEALDIEKELKARKVLASKEAQALKEEKTEEEAVVANETEAEEAVTASVSTEGSSAFDVFNQMTDEITEITLESLGERKRVSQINSIEEVKERKAERERERDFAAEGLDAVNFKSAHLINPGPLTFSDNIVPIARSGEREQPEPVREEKTREAFREDKTEPEAKKYEIAGPGKTATETKKAEITEPESIEEYFDEEDLGISLMDLIPDTEKEKIQAAVAEKEPEVVIKGASEPGNKDQNIGNEPAKATETAEREKEPEKPVLELTESAKKIEIEKPGPDLLDAPKRKNSGDTMDELRRTAEKLRETLATFGVRVTMTEISQGPTVTRFEMQPEVGVKVSKIVGLSDDIKLNMAATDVRIEAPIPGKPAIGIEIPNKESSPVYFRELIEDESFQKSSSNITFAVGKDIEGKAVVTDIAKMPHLLIAGATGSGKSVCINTLIMSILYKASPEDVKLIMIDPKVVELSVYNGIPHLMIPVVTDPRKASAALQWGVSEMTDRYNKFAQYKVRDMKGFNKLVVCGTFDDVPENERPKKMPQIVIIVDELADLMMVAGKEVEESICRLAQLARAAGIHLVVATQRPSVDVITGLIKANMPSRIAFSVSSGVDSRTILDMNGAEKLLGKGDMLFYPQGYVKPARLQGAFVSDDEVTRVVSFLKEQAEEGYDPEVISKMNSVSEASGGNVLSISAPGNEGSGNDELFEKAAKLIIEKDKASIGMLQRAFKIGFNRAARIMDQLAEAGVVGEEEGTKPRKILMSEEQFEQYVEEVL